MIKRQVYAAGSVFLSEEDVHRLTGRSQRAAQIRHLQSLGFEVIVNACGDPIVSRAAVEQRLGAEVRSKWASGPNSGALDDGYRSPRRRRRGNKA